MTVQFYSKILAGSDKSFMVNDLFMVEAAGVEPASEIVVSQESSCFVRFRLGSPGTLRTDKMRHRLVRLISHLPPGPSRFCQPSE